MSNDENVSCADCTKLLTDELEEVIFTPTVYCVDCGERVETIAEIGTKMSLKDVRQFQSRTKELFERFKKELTDVADSVLRGDKAKAAALAGLYELKPTYEIRRLATKKRKRTNGNDSDDEEDDDDDDNDDDNDAPAEDVSSDEAAANKKDTASKKKKAKKRDPKENLLECFIEALASPTEEALLASQVPTSYEALRKLRLRLCDFEGKHRNFALVVNNFNKSHLAALAVSQSKKFSDYSELGASVEKLMDGFKAIKESDEQKAEFRRTVGLVVKESQYKDTLTPNECATALGTDHKQIITAQGAAKIACLFAEDWAPLAKWARMTPQLRAFLRVKKNWKYVAEKQAELKTGVLAHFNSKDTRKKCDELERKLLGGEGEDQAGREDERGHGDRSEQGERDDNDDDDDDDQVRHKDQMELEHQPEQEDQSDGSLTMTW